MSTWGRCDADRAGRTPSHRVAVPRNRSRADQHRQRPRRRRARDNYDPGSTIIRSCLAGGDRSLNQVVGVNSLMPVTPFRLASPQSVSRPHGPSAAVSCHGRIILMHRQPARATFQRLTLPQHVAFTAPVQRKITPLTEDPCDRILLQIVEKLPSRVNLQCWSRSNGGLSLSRVACQEHG